jgi:hypothetical protein
MSIARRLSESLSLSKERVRERRIAFNASSTLLANEYAGCVVNASGKTLNASV